MAVESMPDDYVIKGFLMGHMKEVEGMLDTEYNEAEVKELFKAEGKAEERTQQIEYMLQHGKTVKEIVSFCGYPTELVQEVADHLVAQTI